MLAVVSTLVDRLSTGPDRHEFSNLTGGGTYTFEIWRDHPRTNEVFDLLAQAKEAARTLVGEFVNDEDCPADRELFRSTFYVGQSTIKVSSGSEG